MIRIERHEKGPRVYVLGRRVHECHAGLAALGIAVLLRLIHVHGDRMPAGVIAAVAAIGAWMTIKDARDFVPRWRDTASWSMGIHRREFALRPTPRGAWVPGAIGVLVAMAGLANIAAAVRPEFATRSDTVNDLMAAGVRGSIHAAALPLGLLLVVCGTYLARRRRGAWLLALMLLLITGPVELLHRDIDGAVLAWSLAVTLAVAGNAFTVRRDPHALRAAVARLPVVGALAIATSVAAILAAHRHVTPGLTGSRLMRETADLLAFQNGPLRFGAHAGWVPLGVGLVSAAAIAAAAAPLLRPLAYPRVPARADDRMRARRLVARYGDDSLSFFKLRNDLAYLFSADRRAFLGYRVQRGVLVVSADPVGPVAAIRDLVRELFVFAQEHGLRVAVVGASATLGDIYRSAGMRAVYIGDEAILDAERFSLEGHAIRKVRQAVARLERAGYHVDLMAVADLSSTEIAELDGAAAGWRDGAPARGFSMTVDAVGGYRQTDSRILVARDADGAVRGFSHVAPCAGRPAVKLSLTCRDPHAPNGLVEFMIARGTEALRHAGVQEISLDFVAFGRAVIAPRSMRARLVRRMLAVRGHDGEIARRWRFNAKFRPRWTPRYLMVEGVLSTPRAALAVAELEGLVAASPDDRRTRTKGAPGAVGAPDTA